MNNDIFPCVWFNGNGSEAAMFYSGVFPDSWVTMDTGLVQMLTLKRQSLMLLNAGPAFKPNPSISFLIANESENQTEQLYQSLMEGGTELMPLGAYPFSKKYAWVMDKYGVSWQLYTGDKGNTDQFFVPTLMFANKQNGRAKEAIDFYTFLFPNSTKEGIMEYDGAEDKKGNVQHAQFAINGYTMGCMDSSIKHEFGFNEGISMLVLTNNQEETDYYWDNMVKDGGAESQCGWLKDKFGISWQIAPKQLIALTLSDDKTKANRAMQAMMKMKKIIIADLD